MQRKPVKHGYPAIISYSFFALTGETVSETGIEVSVTQRLCFQPYHVICHITNYLVNPRFQ